MRATCVRDEGFPASVSLRPRYIFRWQGAELTRLPQELTDLLATKLYRMAAVGNCPVGGVKEKFTIYRMAVLLY
jgi:hypothetical protein